MSQKKRRRAKKKKLASKANFLEKYKVLNKEKEKETFPKNKKKLFLYSIPFLIILVSAFSFFFFKKPKTHIKKDIDLNVLLVTLDTTRADRIGVYGYSKAKTPNLDSLALNGVRFSNAYCQVPLTLPSHTSILTGTYPIYHHVHNNGFYYLSPDLLTLAEILKERGFKTAAFVSSFTVDSRFGIDQGFDFYDDKLSEEEMLKTFRSERKAERVYDSFSQWINENYRSKFFCWVHFFDPHMPYNPPSPYKEEFPSNPYDGEIAYMDFYIGEVIEKLKEKNMLEKTLIILAGDHGEAFGEKGEVDHGLFLYNSTMKVPLIFYAENYLPRGRVVNYSVRLIDIMPSILEMLRTKIPEENQGVSLIPFIEGREKEDLPSYIETVSPRENYGWAELAGLIDEGWKYIQAPKSELYNLRADPEEENNVANNEKKIANSMKEKLTRVIKEYTSELEGGEKRLTLEEQERLRSLGYIGGELPATRSGISLPDPKDKLDEFRSLYQARMLEYEEDFQGAANLFRKVLRLNPDVPWNYINLALVFIKMKKIEEAVNTLKQGLKRIPDSLVLLSRLGHFYMRAGKYNEALKTSQAALKIDPQYLDALVISGWVMDIQGKWEESLQFFKKALEVEPENKLVQIKYAYALGAIGKGEEALKIYNGLKKEYPNDYRIYSDLGIVYNSLGNYEMALENLKRAVELKPSPDSYLNYSAILERVGNLKAAIHYLKLYLANTPEGDTPRKIKAREALAQWERKLK